jgi:hypothetical protein
MPTSRTSRTDAHFPNVFVDELTSSIRQNIKDVSRTSKNFFSLENLDEK